MRRMSRLHLLLCWIGWNSNGWNSGVAQSNDRESQVEQHGGMVDIQLLADAHPIHLHLVHFQVMERLQIKWAADTEDGLCENPSCTNGVYFKEQPLVEHMGSIGTGYRAFAPGDNWADSGLYSPYNSTTNPDLDWIYETARLRLSCCLKNSTRWLVLTPHHSFHSLILQEGYGDCVSWSRH